MPTDTEELHLDKDEDERDESTEQEVEEFKPGELCPVDASNNQVDLEDEDDPSGLTVEEKEGCLLQLASGVSKRDLTSRRLQIRDAWKARYFYRGNQYLLPGKNGSWVLPHQVLVGGQSFDDHNRETNIYLAFADTINAALTAGIPSVRFEASNPSNPADISGAENAEKARLLIERDNDMVTIQGDITRYLWTDGLAWVYTRHVVDSQRFGYCNPAEPEIADEISYLPEMPGQPDSLGSIDGGDEGEIERNLEPRGQEVIEAFGALEVKGPIQANDIHACDYVRLSREFDITRMKAKYPKKAEELKPMQSATADSEYERLARTSVMMGMRPSNMTNDAQTYNATEELVWVRPSMYFDKEIKEECRNWLWDNFPQGAYIATVGKTLCEARNEGIDDHWTLIHCRPGDGSHRPATGSPIIPLQEKLNDCMDLVHESFMHLIPRIWVDPNIDVEGAANTQRRPGQYMKAPKSRPEKAISDNFFAEPQIQLAEGLLVYIEKLFGEFAQFLCGAFPALFGGNTGSNDTASGINSQRDQALGRVGLTWRNMRAGYARIIRQAVQAAAEHRKEPMTGEVKTSGGAKEQIKLDPNDLKGNIRCFPDTDENFPESWVAQRAVWTTVVGIAAKNPAFAAIVASTRNLRQIKDKLGTPEMVIPGAASDEKQSGETMLLLQSQPLPNPKLQEAADAFKQTPPPPVGTPPEMIQMAHQKVQDTLKSIPPQVSSVPIGKFDDHAAEMDSIKTFANSPAGIKAKAENPQSWANLELHYDEHAAALQAQQAGGAGGTQKPPSESINFKDLPPDGQVAMAAQAGIKLDEQKLQAEDDQAKAAEAAKAAKPAMPATGGGPAQQQ